MMLCLVKGAYNGPWLGNVVRSDINNNRFHHWSQSESGMRRRRWPWAAD